MSDHRILIVDDSTFDRRILIRAFGQVTKDPPDIEEADTAHAAILKLDQSEFDAVFLDVNMPGENGFYALRRIRERYQGTWPLVFMFSSSNHPDDIAQAYLDLATAYLCKPNDLDALRAMAAGCLGMLSFASPMSSPT